MGAYHGLQGRIRLYQGGFITHEGKQGSKRCMRDIDGAGVYRGVETYM